MMKTETTVRISLTNDAIIRAFFGRAAKHYHYVVTQDDFDEYDNEAPGEYAGVEVPAALGQKWDAGLNECKAAGIVAGSREGWAIRYRAMHGDKPMHADLVRWLDERDAKQAEKAAATARLTAEVQAVRVQAAALIAGGTHIQADEYSGQFWCHGPRETLPLLLTNPYYDAQTPIEMGDRLPPIPGNEPGYRGWSELRRLPNGDIMVISPTSWSRVTFDRSLVVDRQRREKIKTHVYAPELWDAVMVALKAGVLYDSGCVWRNSPMRDEIDGKMFFCYSHGHNRTGEEEVVALRDFATRALARAKTAQHRAMLETVIALATPGSIVETVEA
jgi:hypothetical protein